MARGRGWIQRFDPAVIHTSLFTANIVGQLAARGLMNDAAVTNLRALGVPADRVRVIPRGFDTDPPLPDPSVRIRLGVPPDTALIGNIGRQAAQKGHRLLIEAFERIAAELPRVHLVVLGREGDETELIQDRFACP